MLWWMLIAFKVSSHSPLFESMLDHGEILICLVVQLKKMYKIEKLCDACLKNPCFEAHQKHIVVSHKAHMHRIVCLKRMKHITSPGSYRYTCAGTQTICLIIIYRWTIYILTSCPINRWLAIYECLISFDLHMHLVTSFKCWSLILPSATQTLGDVPVYVLPGFLPNLPQMCEKRAFLLHCLTHRR